MTADPKFWNKIADKYAATPVANGAAFERKKAITREHLTKDAVVFEIGCGTGSLALDLASSAGHIHAMDLSAAMLRIANGKKEASGTANVTFHEGTLDGPVPFEAEHFDSVWAYSILHLVDDRPTTLRRIFELVKPGGSLITSNVCLGETWIPYGALITVMRWFGKAPRVYVHDRDTIVRELDEAGFVDMKVHDVGTDARVAFITASKPQ